MSFGLVSMLIYRWEIGVNQETTKEKARVEDIFISLHYSLLFELVNKVKAIVKTWSLAPRIRRIVIKKVYCLFDYKFHKLTFKLIKFLIQ